MKLLLISSSNNVRNGYGNYTHEFCLELVKKGIPFTLLLPENEVRYDYTSYPVEYVLPPYIFDVKTPKVLKYLTFRYATDATLVHSFNEFPYAVIARRIARQNRIPYVVTAHGTYAVKPAFTFFEGKLLKWAYAGADKVVCVSQFTRDAVAKYCGVQKSTIIHNGVNVERFKNKSGVSELQNRFHNKKILLTTGVVKPRKGHDIILKALGELAKKRDDFYYVAVGPYEEGRDVYVEQLKKYTEEFGLTDKVYFAGSVSDSELVAYFNSSYLFVHTPKIHNWNFEGFGIVYLEASACGKPIVAGDSGGIRDAVVDGKTGIIVPENDPHATALALESLLDNPALAEKMGQAGIEYAREHDWKIIVSKYVDLYKEVLKN